MAHGAGQGDGSGGSEGFGGAQDGAEIAGVLNAGEDDDERLRGAVAEQIGPFLCQWPGEGGDGLGPLGCDGGGENFLGQYQNLYGIGESKLVQEVFVILS